MSRTVELLLSAMAAAVSIGGAALFYGSQASIPGASLWPLPGLVLLVWAVLGCGLFLIILLSREREGSLIDAAWGISGAMIPYIILGAFSIGTLVFLTFLFSIATTISTTITRHRRWLKGLLWLGVGAVLSLLLFGLILWIDSLYTHQI